MGAVVITLLAGSGLFLYIVLTVPAMAAHTVGMGLITALVTMVFAFSFAGLIIWTDDVRAFYRKKHGLIPTVIKIITFPIWLFGILFCAWGAYETVKGVRNWMHEGKK